VRDSEQEFVAYVRERSPALLQTARFLSAGDAHGAEDLLQAALERVLTPKGLRVYDITYRNFMVRGLRYVEVKANSSTYYWLQQWKDNWWRNKGHRVDFYRIRGIPIYKKAWRCVRNCNTI
jgi:hypothetical protein